MGKGGGSDQDIEQDAGSSLFGTPSCLSGGGGGLRDRVRVSGRRTRPMLFPYLVLSSCHLPPFLLFASSAVCPLLASSAVCLDAAQVA